MNNRKVTPENCKNCYTCEDCDTAQKVNDIKCFTCQNCHTAECGGCLTCQNCYTAQNKGCESCITCEKCYTAQNQNCDRCLTCQVKAAQTGISENTDIKLPNPEIPVNNMTVFTTTHCNLRCKYCYLWHYGENKKSDEYQEDSPKEKRYQMHMPEKTMRQTIDWYIVNCPLMNLRIWFFGGEPLFNMKVIKFAVKYMNEQLEREGFGRKCSYGITTNATLITPEVNTFLKEHNMGVLVSMDGCKELHDRNRVYKNGKGSWDNAMKGLDELAKWKDPKTTSIRWTVMPQDLDLLPEAVRGWFEQGYEHVAIEWVYEEDWTPYLVKFKETLDKINDLVIEWKIKHNKYVYVKHLNDGLKYIKVKQSLGNSLRCGTANGHVGISPKGDVFICHRYVINFEDEFSIGNVWDGYDIPKAQAINKKFLGEKITNWQYPEKCKTCSMNIICNGNCLASNYDATGDWMKQPDWVCEMLKVITEVALHFRMKWTYLYGDKENKYLDKASGAKY